MNQFDLNLTKLTSRQKDVLFLFLSGKTDEEIAQSLDIDTNTVRKHIQNICKVFNLKSDSPDTRRSRRHDLIALFAQHKPEFLKEHTSQAMARNTSITSIETVREAETATLSIPEAETVQSKRIQLQKHKFHLERLKEREADYAFNQPPEILKEQSYRIECIKRLNLEIQEELQRLSSLPPQRYVRFVGRQKNINEVLTALKDSNSRPLIAIDGIGGVGKTALAREIVNRTIDANLFYSVVWESTKQEEFTGGGIRQVNPDIVDFDSLLTKIASKLGFFEVRSLKTTEQKRQLVQDILSEERYLVVIDNLETFQGYRDLVNNLEGLFTHSKAILTTRRQVAEFRHVQPFSLGGMEPEDSFDFLRAYASERPGAAEIICLADQGILEEIHQRTGGLPLLMELVVGQLTRFSLRTVLEKLQTFNYESLEKLKSDENIYRQFYRYIYGDSWEQISKKAKDLLICLGEFDLTEGAKIDDAIEVTEMSAAQLEEAAAELIQISLIYRRGQENKQTFFLHPLTHLFVQHEVVGD